MDILIIAAAVLTGILMKPTYQGIRNWRAARKAKRNTFIVSPESTYDKAIDGVTADGLERLQLHRASTSPTVRNRLKGTPLYERAAPVLGWDD
jgi:hypothetical protein